MSITRFAHISDPQIGFSGDVEKDRYYFAKAISQINAAQDISFVLICGDMVDVPESTQQWKIYLHELSKLKVKYYEVPGNHDGWNEAGLNKWRNTFGKKDYFSFQTEDCLFIGLNSLFLKQPNDFTEEREKFISFLERTLELNYNKLNYKKLNSKNLNHSKTNKTKTTFLFQHFPLFRIKSSERESWDSLPADTRSYMFDLLEKYQVRAVFNGHQHRKRIHQIGVTTLFGGYPTSMPLGVGRRGYHIHTYDSQSDKLTSEDVLIAKEKRYIKKIKSFETEFAI